TPCRCSQRSLVLGSFFLAPFAKTPLASAAPNAESRAHRRCVRLRPNLRPQAKLPRLPHPRRRAVSQTAPPSTPRIRRQSATIHAAATQREPASRCSLHFQIVPSTTPRNIRSTPNPVQTLSHPPPPT